MHIWKDVEGADAARGASRNKEREGKATEERRSERECVSVCETGVVGRDEIETMDVSEQECEMKGKRNKECNIPKSSCVSASFLSSFLFFLLLVCGGQESLACTGALASASRLHKLLLVGTHLL